MHMRPNNFCALHGAFGAMSAQKRDLQLKEQQAGPGRTEMWVVKICNKHNVNFIIYIVELLMQRF